METNEIQQLLADAPENTYLILRYFFKTDALTYTLTLVKVEQDAWKIHRADQAVKLHTNWIIADTLCNLHGSSDVSDVTWQLS